MKKGKIIIISGPSGSGKTTLYKKLLANPKLKNRLVKSISVTTRPKRSGEKNGRDYFFVSSKMFRYKQHAGHFLESMKVFDNYYGTSEKQVRDILGSGKNVLLCIDVQGARVICRKFPSCLRIFIKTPSINELKKRLQERGSEKKQVIKLRLETARHELKESKYYDYVIINASLKKAYCQLENIISSENSSQL